MQKALRARYILFCGNQPLYGYSVIVNNDKIEDILPNSEVNKNKYKIINLEDCILMPGFINAHIHLELNWIRRKLIPFNSFSSWLAQIIDLKKQTSKKEMIINSVRKSLKESIDSGVTTIGQISSYNGLDFQEIIRSKIRTVYFFEVVNSTMPNIDKSFFRKLINLDRKDQNGMFNLRLFPHSIYTLDTEKLQNLFKIAQNRKINLGIHLSESRDEIRLIQKKKSGLEDIIFPMLPKRPKIKIKSDSPLSYLNNLNKNKQRILLVHMNNLIKADLKILEREQYGVVLCPRSNLFLNQRLPNLKFFLKYKNIGLGTDGLSSNFSINFLDEIKSLYLHSKKFAKKNCEKIVLEKATIGGARALGIENMVGTIKKNKKADLIAFRIKNDNPFMSVIDSNNNDLKLSMINGETIKLK